MNETILDQKQKVSILYKMKRVIRFMISSLFIVFFLTILAVSFLWITYGDEMKTLVDQANAKLEGIDDGTFKSHMDTILYDANGKEIKRLAEHEYFYMESKEIQPDIKHAFVAIEDQRYYEHPGVDIQSILRAGIELIKNRGEITQGGSTITQQLVKNVFLSQQKTYTRKIEEMLIAVKLEKLYSKDTILEFYVNNIYFGNGVYGIESASQYYFSKSSKELNVAEIAYLVAIPNNPSYYNPRKYPNNVEERKNRILSKMKELGFLSNVQYQEALKFPVVLKIRESKNEMESYAINFAIASATKGLMEQEGFVFEYDFKSDEERKVYEVKRSELQDEINQRIRSGGYKIFTSLNLQHQAILQQSIDRGLENFQAKDEKTGQFKTQGAGVIIDNHTGMVTAIVGGRSQAGVINWFNRASQGYRQPGSAIKPLVAYIPSFEEGMLSSTRVMDRPIKNGPVNAQGKYYGSVTMRFATELSLNTIPFEMVKDVTPKRALRYLKEMKFGKIVDGDNHAGIGVGGFTYGVTPLEMAGAYSALARNGKHTEPTAILRIEDQANKVIYTRKQVFHQVYDPGSTYLMTDVLQGTLQKRHASGYGLSVPNIPTAGKTGTTNDSKDGWFSGYTPYYTATVWVGNDIPTTINKLYGATYPGRIWKEFMSEIHKGLPSISFVVPDDVQEMYAEAYSGRVSKTPFRGWKKEWVPNIYLDIHPELLRLKVS